MAISVTHPLDPLSADELAAAVAAVRAQPGLDDVRFVDVALEEPAKDALRAGAGNGHAPVRAARAVLLDPARARGLEVRVDLAEGRVTAVDEIEGMQPAIHGTEFVEAGEAVRRDPGYQAALARRGLTPDQVHVEPWSCGDFEAGGLRVARAISWRNDGDPNPYAHPIGGLVAVVDLNAMAVVRLDDHGPVPIPEESGDYRQPAGGFRDDLRDLRITQPDGPSFGVEGHALTWQNWRLRLGWTSREALVLHELAFRDGDEWRPVAHRASIAELVIPYGDPAPTTHYKNAFDVGEYGMGPSANALELGCDCLGEIRYVDADLTGWRGEPMHLPNAICLHEEDTGILWKHTDSTTGDVQVRRARRLVVSCICTVGNYEYGYFWYLHQDGSIAFECKLTGILHTTAVHPGQASPQSTEVAPGLAAPIHQHFLCARLDLDVDGPRNRLVEVELERDPKGPENPHGTNFRTRRTVLASEAAAQRTVDARTARRWRVESTERTNRMGTPTAYELVPGETVGAGPWEDSTFVRRAGFITRHLWATPYRPDERYPAGEYPNQHAGGDGLPRWTQADRGLDGEDVVLWYVFGAHHAPRLEDWPVMPVASCGFSLRPVGFFDRNPTLDVPPPGRRALRAPRVLGAGVGRHAAQRAGVERRPAVLAEGRDHERLALGPQRRQPHHHRAVLAGQRHAGQRPAVDGHVDRRAGVGDGVAVAVGDHAAHELELARAVGDARHQAGVGEEGGEVLARHRQVEQHVRPLGQLGQLDGLGAGQRVVGRQLGVRRQRGELLELDPLVELVAVGQRGRQPPAGQARQQLVLPALHQHRPARRGGPPRTSGTAPGRRAARSSPGSRGRAAPPRARRGRRPGAPPRGRGRAGPARRPGSAGRPASAPRRGRGGARAAGRRAAAPGRRSSPTPSTAPGAGTARPW